MATNIGNPLGFLPGSPWFGQTASSKPSGNHQAPPTFTVSQKVIAKSKFAANPGVLVSGRRPDRPGS